MLLFVFTFVLVLSEVDVEVDVEFVVVLTSEVVLTVETVVVWANAAPDARRARTASNLFIVPSECYHNETISEFIIKKTIPKRFI
jgi:hypothetical protein